MILILLFLALSTNSIASEGSSGRGGGDGIACTTAGTTQVELLDYYEARLTTDFKIDLGPDTYDFMDQITYVTTRLARVDSVAADRYWMRAKTFLSETKFLSADQMVALRDDNESVAPGLKCSKEQFAIQIFDPKPGQARYLVNQDLWNAADSKTRAGLVLHEMVYRDAVEAGQGRASDDARYFNAQISSTQMGSTQIDDYIRVVTASHMVGADFSVRPYSILPAPIFESVLFGIRPATSQGSLCGLDDTNVCFENGTDDLFVRGVPVSRHLPLKMGEFLPVSLLSCAIHKRQVQPDDGCLASVLDDVPFFPVDAVAVFGTAANMAKNAAVFVTTDFLSAHADSFSTVYFSLNGEPRGGTVEKDMVFLQDGKQIAVKAGAWVRFSAQGFR